MLTVGIPSLVQAGVGPPALLSRRFRHPGRSAPGHPAPSWQTEPQRQTTQLTSYTTGIRTGAFIRQSGSSAGRNARSG